MTASAGGAGVSLREYIEELLRLRDAAFDAYRAEHVQFVTSALAALKEAADKAQANTDKRFDRVDELRQQLEIQVRGALPRTEADTRFTATADRAEQAAARSTEQLEALRTTIEKSAFVTRELFDRYADEQRQASGRFIDQLTVLYTDVSNMKGRSTAISAALATFFTIVSITVAVLTRVP
jgi:hypothetical protein